MYLVSVKDNTGSKHQHKTHVFFVWYVIINLNCHTIIRNQGATSKSSSLHAKLNISKLLMVQKSGVHHLRLVVHPIIHGNP